MAESYNKGATGRTLRKNRAKLKRYIANMRAGGAFKPKRGYQVDKVAVSLDK